MFHVKQLFMENVSACPLCGNTVFSIFLHSKDYFFSGEEFDIVKCTKCGLKLTNPRPEADEIGRYYESEDYLSHDVKKKSLISSIYKIARKISLGNKFRLVKKWSNGKDILDIGCGTGEFLGICQQKGMTVTGIEPNIKAASYAREVNKIRVYDEKYLESLSEPSFDVITMWHVLEHVHDLNERMSKISQLLRSSGILILAVPNSSAFDAELYKTFWAAYDLPRHLYHFSQETILMLGEKHHFRIEKILPMKMDAYYISLLSEKYANGKQNFLAALKNGFLSNLNARRNSGKYSSLIFIFRSQGGGKEAIR